MNRPFTDIAIINQDQPIKNGSILGLTTPTGKHQTYDYFVTHIPTINDIYNKYGNKFYNGIFVQLNGGQTLIGA